MYMYMKYMCIAHNIHVHVHNHHFAHIYIQYIYIYMYMKHTAYMYTLYVPVHVAKVVVEEEKKNRTNEYTTLE